MNLKAKKRILITGNGFDLALGLPTSYNDFIDVIRFVQQSEDGAIDIRNALPAKFEKLNEYYSLQQNYDFKKIKEDQYAQNLWLKYFCAQTCLGSQNSDKNGWTLKEIFVKYC